MKNALLITAHPDDHFFCVGMLANLKKKGFNIREIVLSKAELSGYIEKGKYVTNPDQKKKDTLSILKQQRK
jgi:LmbE family N-acetylglucosaminyl deacetylase|tara:strand:- start:41 stop:253 length:213 start_codon:yes stop_codon:yes gene_type:complete